MCGRVMEGDFSQLKVAFGIPDDYPALNYAPSWNVARPTACRLSATTGRISPSRTIPTRRLSAGLSVGTLDAGRRVTR
jgi:hypothetical protein